MIYIYQLIIISKISIRHMKGPKLGWRIHPTFAISIDMSDSPALYASWASIYRTSRLHLSSRSTKSRSLNEKSRPWWSAAERLSERPRQLHLRDLQRMQVSSKSPMYNNWRWRQRYRTRFKHNSFLPLRDSPIFFPSKYRKQLFDVDARNWGWGVTLQQKSLVYVLKTLKLDCAGH